MVVRQILVLFVEVRILVGQQEEGVSKVTEAPFFYFQFLEWVYAQWGCINSVAGSECQYGFCGKLGYGKRQNTVGGVQGQPPTSDNGLSSQFG